MNTVKFIKVINLTWAAPTNSARQWHISIYGSQDLFLFTVVWGGLFPPHVTWLFTPDTEHLRCQSAVGLSRAVELSPQRHWNTRAVLSVLLFVALLMKPYVCLYFFWAFLMPKKLHKDLPVLLIPVTHRGHRTAFCWSPPPVWAWRSWEQSQVSQGLLSPAHSLTLNSLSLNSKEPQRPTGCSIWTLQIIVLNIWFPMCLNISMTVPFELKGCSCVKSIWTVTKSFTVRGSCDFWLDVLL